jgi:calcium-dependent protein kinase
MRHQSAKQEVEYILEESVNSDEYLKHALMEEIHILQQLRSQNIVAVFEVMESSNNYYIIQELCDSDLEKYLKHTPVTSENKAVEMLRQIINGFVTLVREGIIHRYSNKYLGI